MRGNGRERERKEERGCLSIVDCVIRFVPSDEPMWKKVKRSREMDLSHWFFWVQFLFIPHSWQIAKRKKKSKRNHLCLTLLDSNSWGCLPRWLTHSMVKNRWRNSTLSISSSHSLPFIWTRCYFSVKEEGKIRIWATNWESYYTHWQRWPSLVPFPSLWSNLTSSLTEFASKLTRVARSRERESTNIHLLKMATFTGFRTQDSNEKLNGHEWKGSRSREEEEREGECVCKLDQTMNLNVPHLERALHFLDFSSNSPSLPSFPLSPSARSLRATRPFTTNKIESEMIHGQQGKEK